MKDKVIDRRIELQNLSTIALIAYSVAMYKILKNDSPQKLELEVQKYLKNGWSVAGGVSVSPASEYFQAVINSTKIQLHTKKRI